MTRTLSFDNQRRFDFVYGGLLGGQNFVVKVAAAKGEIYPFDKTRRQSKILRKFKRISEEVSGKSERKLLEPLPQIVKLDEDEVQLLKELYEKVDWTANVTDEVVDALDWMMGAPQEES